MPNPSWPDSDAEQVPVASQRRGRVDLICTDSQFCGAEEASTSLSHDA